MLTLELIYREFVAKASTDRLEEYEEEAAQCVLSVERRLNEYGISIRARYADLTDAELHRIIEEIKLEHPLCGNQQMRGHLLSRGLRVQQHRIREAQHAVDPEGSIMRRLRVIHRRTYSVPAPRSLWHIDGNHKLIRYEKYNAFS